MARELLIGEVADRSGVSRKALRLDEARGILPRPSRTHSGYRVYEPESLAILRFVTMARQLGLRQGLSASPSPVIGEARRRAGLIGPAYRRLAKGR